MSILHVDDSQIPIYTEAGDLTGWATEEEAALMIRGNRKIATMQARGHKQERRLIMIASESAPMTPSARAQARASYLGKALKTTYRENLNSPGSTCIVAPIVMLKRALPDGRFVKW